MVHDHDVCGLTWEQVAEKYGIPLRTVHRRKDEHHAAAASGALVRQQPADSHAPEPEKLRDVFDIDPVTEVRRLVDVFDLAIANFEAIAMSSSHENYRIGATRGMVEAHTARFTTLQRLGLLPAQLEFWNVLESNESLRGVMVELLKRPEVSDEMRDWFLERLDQVVIERQSQRRGA